ncbi:DUF3825 domain-containing protein [Microcoleus sp. FACHB-1515]|uniref:DUF3825 domain-containing protein n=1 Tax=Cyanophyceae TaxID=3028117 RepID=UPI0016863083|nr:DUF3825 domain-containing protein [Microcoleus sp. FACHB-1515]MBD2091387.1 DUF3825 domain-containing protein [Microcoleus sp. FACHB-1515]
MGYESLFRRYKNQDRRTVFAHFPWKGDQGETWETPFTRLVELAKPEDWNFSNIEFTRVNESYPILTNYLNYTFLRLQEEEKVVFSDDGDRACFNTGLQTTTEKDIFATFFRNKRAEEFNSPTWTLYGFFDSYSQKLKDFFPIPEVATYITDPGELVFDFGYEIDINYDHILEENQHRLPEILQQNRKVAISSIQGAVYLLKERIKRNYKLAIPHWYENKIQLLLPLNITSEEHADLALVADKDKDRKLYRIRTVLTMDMAYIDARLICRPDRYWLDP